MTLTTILPSLRRSIPDPFVPDHWPAHTSLSITDVIVTDVPMLHLVARQGTPLVHTAAAVIPGTGGCPSSTERTSVVVTRVVAVATGDDGHHLTLAAHLPDADVCWSELRLIGRASTTHSVAFHVDSASSVDPADDERRVQLPRDLAPGDLLAVPCRGGVAQAVGSVSGFIQNGE
ncbi:hypothetical protein ITJ57_00255 [Plantibacter sp. VKM Ac-2880]|uniref:hypothetical protein n=1 Tax=Plantibacter sp. VKM Ac-2880 TaxID=2783827 RepID=UPI00188F4097|nr:hypothetical protein [Plantibacter sp. VKM Ac-2880]MBF4567182.1 hypothetical protein [Plantibacter sp. VKM Ac-2880]